MHREEPQSRSCELAMVGTRKAEALTSNLADGGDDFRVEGTRVLSIDQEARSGSSGKKEELLGPGPQPSV